MEFNYDSGFFKRHAKQFNNLGVLVTIADEDNKFYKRVRRPNRHITKDQLKRRSKTNAYQDPRIKLRTISEYLEEKKGIYTNAMKKSKNQPIENLAAEFSRHFFNAENLSPNDIKRLENLGQAIVRNNFLYKRFGRNKKSTVKNKGFDLYGVDTGQVFEAIKGHFIEGIN